MQAVKAGIPAEGGSMRALAARARSIAVVSDIASLLDLLLYVVLVAVAYVALVNTGFHWATSILALCVVAKAQNALLLSGHEAVHYLLFRNRKLNDWAGAYMCFGPMGVGFNRARAAHLDHHSYLLSERDEKLDQQLERPSRRAYLAHLLKPLFGSYLFRGILRILGRAPSVRAKPQYKLSDAARRLDLMAIGGSSLVLLAVLVAIDWRLWLFFWVLPLLTLTAFFHNAKAFLDHARLADESDDLLYSYRVSWIDRLFFGTQQARHAEHHLFPFVPYHRLPHLESALDAVQNVKQRPGYFAFLFRYWWRANEF